MADRLPSLNALRAFDCVARHLSVTKAADELHVTPAAVSLQIKALEADLGAKLVRRDGRGLALTTAGRSGLADLGEGFDRLARAARTMRPDRDRQMLTVSVEPSFAATWLVRRLDRFKRDHLGIDVRIDASMDRADFARDGVDVGIRYGTGDYPGLDVVRLFDDEVFPVCAPALMDGVHPLVEPGDLRWHTLLHLDWPPHMGEWPDWSSWLRAAGVDDVDAGPGPHFTDESMALQAAVQGQGVALGNTALVADDLVAGRLVWPFALCLPTMFAYYVVCPEDRADDPTVTAFRNWLLVEAAA